MRIKRKAYLRRRELLALVQDTGGFKHHCSSSKKDVGPVANVVLCSLKATTLVVLTCPLDHVILGYGGLPLVQVLFPRGLLFGWGPAENKI